MGRAWGGGGGASLQPYVPSAPVCDALCGAHAAPTEAYAASGIGAGHLVDSGNVCWDAPSMFYFVKNSCTTSITATIKVRPPPPRRRPQPLPRPPALTRHFQAAGGISVLQSSDRCNAMRLVRERLILNSHQAGSALIGAGQLMLQLLNSLVAQSCAAAELHADRGWLPGRAVATFAWD